MSSKNKSENIYGTGLGKGPANYASLSPINFLRRTASVYPNKTAVIYGDLKFSYGEFFARCRGLAFALQRDGVGSGDTVSVMAPNIPPMLECHYGVPMVGAILNAINTRLDSASIAFILEHSEAKVLIVDQEYLPIVLPAIKNLKHIQETTLK